LIGFPVRIVAGGKKVQPGSVEIKTRDGKLNVVMPAEEVIGKILEIVKTTGLMRAG
jgi:hypothetical protein